jgi:hypothetical protein
MKRMLFVTIVGALIGYGLLLWLAGPVVLVFTAMLCLFGVIAWMNWADRRPISDTDRECDRIDQELDRERAVRRLARQREREGQSSLFGPGGGWRSR